jgi:hypothetical protein
MDIYGRQKYESLDPAKPDIILEVVVDVVCDICGLTCKKKYNYEKATFGADWGYDSGKDTERWRCDLCEGCADKVKAFIESIGGEVHVKEYN